MKISVIMASYLEDYPNSRKDPERKFMRAVKSFLQLDYPMNDCELVIVSDGCEKTNQIYDSYFINVPNISLIKAEKSSSKYPGKIRQLGVESAKYDIITYLDADDMLAEFRLKNIKKWMDQKHWPYLLDTWLCIPSQYPYRKELVIANSKSNRDKFICDEIEFKYIWTPRNVGTYQLVHRKSCGVEWTDTETRGEDTLFNQKLIDKYGPPIIKDIGGYCVCHNSKWELDI